MCRHLVPLAQVEIWYPISFSQQKQKPLGHTYQPLTFRCFSEISLRKGFTNLYVLMQFYLEQISLNSVQIKDGLKLIKSLACILFMVREKTINRSKDFQEQSLTEIVAIVLLQYTAKYLMYKYVLVK